MSGPVLLVEDLRISHECWGSISDPSINGYLDYPNDTGRWRIHSEFVWFLFLQTNPESDRFFADSGVQLRNRLL